MKEWNKPEIDELSVKETASGNNPDTYESKSRKSSKYDSVNYERTGCNIIPRKDAAES